MGTKHETRFQMTLSGQSHLNLKFGVTFADVQAQGGPLVEDAVGGDPHADQALGAGPAAAPGVVRTQRCRARRRTSALK